MMDEQIAAQLAEQVMGWKIPPDDNCEKYYERQKFFGDDANYPSYDPKYKLLWRDRSCDGVKWNPFESWGDAMALAEKWVAEDPDNRTTGHEYIDGEYAWTCNRQDYFHQDHPFTVIDKSGPRAVTMAVAKAAGIEVEG